MFERLIAVSGIGPKLALSVLSGIETRDLVGAIRRTDLARLTAIPGIGKKTAERMCVELRDRGARVASGVKRRQRHLDIVANTGDIDDQAVRRLFEDRATQMRDHRAARATGL